MKALCDLPNCEGANITSLNEACFCLSLARQQIDGAIVEASADLSLEPLLTARTNLFAGTGVFLSSKNLDAMMDQIHAIEAAALMPPYQRKALSWSRTPLLDAQPQTRGVLMGYDFHIAPDGPRLIEVNTNAGGVFLVHALTRAVKKGYLPTYLPFGAIRFEERIGEMMCAEWRAAGRLGAPKALAIVDENPQGQYLYPDMVLARDLLNEQGIKTLIVDAAALSHSPKGLMAGGTHIDMVYNRLTDFALAQPLVAPLRKALLADQIVVTPSPRHHALYADKRNLAILSDPSQRQTIGLSAEHHEALACLPKTAIVSRDNASSLWANRKDLFFKPTTGFGGCATYRGSKLTRRVWDEILQSDYVAQTFVAPQLRGVLTSEGNLHLKYDIRVYTYAGDPLMVAARVYQGQTTNFRTPGGGFAPVIVTNV